MEQNCPATSKFGIGVAIQWMRNGNKVARTGWNGKGMWVRLVPAMIEGTTGIALLPYIQMFTADKSLIPWPASQTDLLAEDWELVR